MQKHDEQQQPLLCVAIQFRACDKKQVYQNNGLAGPPVMDAVIPQGAAAALQDQNTRCMRRQLQWQQHHNWVLQQYLRPLHFKVSRLRTTNRLHQNEH